MSKIFVYEVQESVSKAGKPYRFQQIQIMQMPAHPDVWERHFVGNEAEALPVGLSAADIFLVNTRQGTRPRFENVTPQKA